MAGDIGGYFEKMTKKARGGRRLDSDTPATEYGLDDRDAASGSAPAPTAPRSGGSLKDMLKDVLGKGRTTAKTTTKKATDKVRETASKRRGKPTTPAARELPPEGVVTIEYAPRIDGDPDPGEVVWSWVPFEEDPEQGKDRPVVVIGRRGPNLVGVPLTTKRNDREAQIAIGTGDWDPKHRPSYARIWRMLDLESEGMRREGAVLDRDRFDQLIAGVDQYYDVRRPAPSKNARSGDADFDYDY